MAERRRTESGGQRDTAAERDQRRSGERTTEPDAQRIAQRAYERYQARGGEHGHDQEDWFAAEQELRGGAGRASGEIAGDVDARRLEESARDLGRTGRRK